MKILKTALNIRAKLEFALNQKLYCIAICVYHDSWLVFRVGLYDSTQLVIERHIELEVSLAIVARVTQNYLPQLHWAVLIPEAKRKQTTKCNQHDLEFIIYFDRETERLFTNIVHEKNTEYLKSDYQACLLS